MVLKPKVAGTMQAARAMVDYQYKVSPIDATGGEEGAAAPAEETVDVTSYSTTPGRVEIATLAFYTRYTATYTAEVGVVLAAAIIAIVWPYRMWAAAKAVNTRAKRA